MTITDCIQFCITSLVDLLSSTPIFPFVGIWVAAFVIGLIFSIIHIRR